jgi:hypothetical protein
VRARFVLRLAEFGLLAGVILAAMLLALVWTRVIPIFQSPDEQVHYDYATSIAAAGRLISTREGPAVPLIRHEVLGVASPLTLYLERRTDFHRIIFNKGQAVAAGYGAPEYFADLDRDAPVVSRSFYNHPHAVPFLTGVYPFLFYAVEGTVICAASKFWGPVHAFFAARYACTAMFGIALLFSYLSLRELRFGFARALLITAIIGFLPLSSFVGSYVQPDNLAFTLVSATFYLALRVRNRAGSVSSMLWLGVVLGLLSVTKSHVFLAVLVPVAGLVVTSYGRLSSSPRRWIFAASALVLPALALNSIEYLYVEPANSVVGFLFRVAHTGWGVVRASAQEVRAGTEAAAAITWTGKAFHDYFGVDGTTALSFWGDFGWLDTPLVIVNERVESVVHLLVFVLSLCAIAGVAAIFFRNVRIIVRAGRAGHRLLAARLAFADPVTFAYLCFAIIVSSLYVLSENLYVAQGRNWFPFLLPIVLIAVDRAPRGLGVLFGRRATGAAQIAMTSLLSLYCIVGSCYALFDVHVRYYHAPDAAAFNNDGHRLADRVLSNE